MSEKALIMLENDLGVKLDIVKDPLSLTAYDLEGNVISGGGGGAPLNPCHLTVINNTGNTTAVLGNFVISNGVLSSMMETLADSTPVEIDMYYQISGDDTFIEIGFVPGTTPTASNEINCTFDYTDPTYPMILLTDTGESSLTITLS